jgi:hypothetical protein
VSGSVRQRLARRLRFLADRIDYDGSFRHMSAVSGFTFEEGVGIVFRDDGRGCPLWYRNPDYDRAHDEAGTSAEATHLWVNLGRWDRMQQR